MAKAEKLSFRHATSVTTRLIAALVGGYLFAWGLSLWTSSLLGMTDREARSLLSMIFFLYYAATIICVVARNSLWRCLTEITLCNAVVWGLWFTVGGGNAA